MSYCRWSTDDFNCDLYIYESVYDCWTIHVAGARYPEGIPPSPNLFDLAAKKITMDQYRAARQMRDEWMEGREMVPIDLPGAGETFNLPSPGECADKVDALVALGFRCPAGVTSVLREEQADLDARDRDAAPGKAAGFEAEGQQPGPEGDRPTSGSVEARG